jgi:hypothetical protein
MVVLIGSFKEEAKKFYFIIYDLYKKASGKLGFVAIIFFREYRLSINHLPPRATKRAPNAATIVSSITFSPRFLD